MDSRKFKAPKIAASCFCSRKPQYYFFNAYFLIFLITSCSLSIFSINHKLPQNRLATSFTILLSSVSFKWVINRSLPTISYMTSLDRYAMFSMIFIVACCIWHSIIGSSILPGDLNSQMVLDQWALIGFSALFCLLHIISGFWFYSAYKNVKRIKEAELKYLSGLNSTEA